LEDCVVGLCNRYPSIRSNIYTLVKLVEYGFYEFDAAALIHIFKSDIIL
jgi:hypothetical protein